MEALSIRQPWAWLIVNGYKDIENRSRRTHFRGRIYVHTGKNIASLDDFPEQWEYIRQSGIVIPPNLPTGAIVGEVTIADCVEFSKSPWFSGRYGYTLEAPAAYETPVPCRGQLGFFAVDENLIQG